MHPLETYLRELRDIRSTGAAVKETSYYPALGNLLNAAGRTLKPQVRFVSTIKNVGAGIPDGGLFTADQLNRTATGAPFIGQPPARGAVEVKGTAETVTTVAGSTQVAKYLERYGQVLVTNYRDFQLVGRGPGGQALLLEEYRLAANETAFWAAAAQPVDLVDEHGERFVEFLTRVMLHNAPLTSPEDLARFLASYARDARVRVERTQMPALSTVRQALEEALGINFEGQRGEHFFRSTLVQTLFYGVFSAWVLWSKHTPPGDNAARFDWRMAVWSLHVPMIRALFERVVIPSTMQQLGLVEVLDWTTAVLNRVERATFFARFEQEHAVQYFYEPFLQAFDPQLRKELGVWYTPPEIIRYMVARVDTVLREELGCADGLADPSVYILDPCCGTGGYLVEVIRHIAATLAANGGDALGGDDLRRAATERVFGFELLPAPFVVAHLQLGLLLDQLGAPLSEQQNQRAAVYLTNALTGWEPPTGPKQQLIYPELEAERDAAARIKRDTPILVVLGNPPYNGLASIAVAEERGLSTAYRTTNRAPAPQGQGLNDLYVRFFRMAERRIVEGTGRGVVCYISNYSWLDGLSFTGMRERYLEVFDRIWIDNLHGDRIISEYSPDGQTSETIFAIQGTSPGIRVGTAITMLVRNTSASERNGTLLYRDMTQARAAARRAALLGSIGIDDIDSSYTVLSPLLGLGLPFKPRAVGVDFLTWPLLPDLFPVSFPGIQPSRDDVVVDVDRARLVRRMEQYFDPNISDAEMRHIAPGAMESTAQFKAETTRAYLRKRGFLPDKIVRYYYRPFDTRWLYWEPETDLLDRKRSEYVVHIFDGNIWLAATQQNRRDFDPPVVSALYSSRHIVERGANLFPLYLKQAQQPDLFSMVEPDQATPEEPRHNLSEQAISYLQAIGNVEDAVHLFYHTVAVLHAPAYRVENAGALRQDWPRIPLPDSRDALLASAALGRQLAALLDTEHGVPGVTTGKLAPELLPISVVSRAGGGNLNPASDLAVTAGWGHGGGASATMPGKGRAVERAFLPDEQTSALLGASTFDIYLNDIAYWRNIPARVWEYTIGGYQVIKKWLSYREQAVLGRSLTSDEVREVMQMARRIAAILLLEPRLDANYRAIAAATWDWAGAA